MFNIWQKGKLKKYKIEEKDISLIDLNLMKIHDGNKTHNEKYPFKHYTCECWWFELLWFIDKLWWKCRNCNPF